MLKKSGNIIYNGLMSIPQEKKEKLLEKSPLVVDNEKSKLNLSTDKIDEVIGLER